MKEWRRLTVGRLAMGGLAVGGGLLALLGLSSPCSPPLVLAPEQGIFSQETLASSENQAYLEDKRDQILQEDKVLLPQPIGDLPKGKVFPESGRRSVSLNSLDQKTIDQKIMPHLAAELERLSINHYTSVKYTTNHPTSLEGAFYGERLVYEKMTYTPSVEFSLSLDPKGKVWLNMLEFSDDLTIHVVGKDGGMAPRDVPALLQEVLSLGWNYLRAKQELPPSHSEGTAADRFAADRLYTNYQEQLAAVFRRYLPPGCIFTEQAVIECK